MPAPPPAQPDPPAPVPAPVPEPVFPPDRSLELADRSYRMVDYTWFRVRDRLPDLPAPAYLGRGEALSPQYNIGHVRQAPMPQHVVVKVALTAGGAVGRSKAGPLWQLRPGEAVLRFVEENEDFWEAYHPGHRGPWEFVGLILNGATAVSHARSLLGRYGRVYRLGLDHLLVRRLLQVARAPDHVTEMSASAAMRLADDAFEALLAAAEAGAASRGRGTPDLPLAAEKSLRNDLSHDWTVAELAKRHGVSREHLSRTFKRHHGVAPHEYLLQLRLQEAVRRLRGGTEPIKVIAFDLGFQSHASFIRSFRRHHGLAPSQYRSERSGE